jgi:glutamate racemase
MPTNPTIGVFDSGFGGLTVLRALLPRIPGAHYIYLGDTARLPYGAKSQTTIARYAVESARFLEQRGADYLVIACNTATALALPEIRAAVSIPVVGVIEPGAKAAAAALIHKICHPEPSAKDLLSHPGDTTQSVLVLATQATVHSHAYRNACAHLGLHTTEKACPLLVPLVEEGWTDHAVTRDVLRIYLTEALSLSAPQAVLLGCTHYPLIAAEITAMLRTLGSSAEVIDSAEATAAEVARQVDISPLAETAPATFECFATDSVEKFQRLGSHFLGQPIPRVELLDLGG